MNIYQKLFLILIWISLTLIASYLIKKIYPNQAELSRKIVHIGTGPIIVLAWLFELPKAIAVSASTLVTIGLALNYKFRFMPTIEDIGRRSYGTIGYGISITTLLVIFWPENAAAVCIGILSMAFGDGLAGLIGQRVKSPTWTILGQKKSLAGTITITFIVAGICSILSSFISIDISAINIICISVLATGIEQISPYGIDNITLPIGITYAWVLLIGS